jgi:ABC-2 type transport system ATP-binding protein
LISELAARFNGEVPGLQVHRPSLEDTYLSLIASDGAARQDAEGGAM